MKYLFVLFLFFATQSTARTFYVSNAGNDANNGLTQMTTWRTLSKVTSFILLPGDTVLLRRGDMWREQLILQESGTASQRIVIGAYGQGARPIINAANIKTGWTQFNTNVWSNTSTGVVSRRAMVIVDTTIYRRVNSIAELTPNTYWINTAPTPDSVYIYGNPTGKVVQMSQRDNGIYTNQSTILKYCTIQDIEVRYASGHGIYLEGSGLNSQTPCYVTILRCHAYANRLTGIASYDGHAFDTIDSCISSFNGNGIYSWGADNQTVRNCYTFESIHYPGSDFTDGGGIQNFQGKNWLVENCISYRDNDAIHIDAGGVSTNAIIRYCKVSYAKTGNPATPGMGVGSLGAGAKVQFYYNELTNNAEAGLTSWTLSQGIVEVFNNTIYSNDSTGIRWGFYARYGQNFIFKNNLVVTANQSVTRLYQQDPVGTTAILNYNGYYQVPPQSPRWRFSADYTTLALWRTATNQDMNSVYGDPLFVNNRDWRLQATSPMIDKGTNLGLPARDINGLPIIGLPDIGCHEYQSVIVPPQPPTILTFEQWMQKYFPGTHSDIRVRYDASNKQ